MKKTFLTAFSGFALLFAVLFVGCQQEDQVAPDGKITFRDPPTACTNAAPTWSSGSSTLCAGDPLTVTFCVSASCGLQQMFYLVAPGDWDNVAQELPTDGCVSYTIPAAAAGTYTFGGHYVGNGGGCGQNVCSVNQNVNIQSYTVVACGCDDSFTAECSDDGCGENTITFTYVAGEDGSVVIQGGLNANAVICSVASSEGTVIPWGNPNDASVRRLAVDVEECDEVTVTISWDGPGNTGSWSAKRDGTAVGGDLEDGYLSAQDCSDPE